MSAFEDAVKKPFTYMIFDMSPETMDDVRILSNYFEENGSGIKVYQQPSRNFFI